MGCYNFQVFQTDLQSGSSATEIWFQHLNTSFSKGRNVSLITAESVRQMTKNIFDSSSQHRPCYICFNAKTLWLNVFCLLGIVDGHILFERICVSNLNFLKKNQMYSELDCRPINVFFFVFVSSKFEDYFRHASTIPSLIYIMPFSFNKIYR